MARKSLLEKPLAFAPPMSSCADPVGRNSVDPFRRNKNAP